jgi:1,4-alpha-glucan branching enzyme
MPEFDESASNARDNAVLRIPAKINSHVDMRFASVEARDKFAPHHWRLERLGSDTVKPGWYSIDLNALGLPDGVYEYEFVLDDRANEAVADPFADEITRFGGYRGVFRIKDGKRWRPPFSWDDEFAADVELANNHELVIYEMPMRWMESAPEKIRQVGLGTFEKAVFAHLDRLQELGINAIELLPVQDSADTLNWGYGTRFFFAPDLDMGPPLDLKFFIKHCHRRGIRVIFDVVMNHARLCPLRQLDYAGYFLTDEDEERGYRGEDYGAQLFRYWPDENNQTPVRTFQLQMAEHFITEYHADGFRIDEFKGINNWEFIQQFREHAWRTHQRLFPGRPFLVIAEDSWRRAVITQPFHNNPNGRRVTDSMWNFAFRDELRRSLQDAIHTAWGQASRRDRIEWMITGKAIWDDWKKEAQHGFYDMVHAVNYLTSHDVEQEHEKRIMNFLFAPLLESQGYRSAVDDIRWVADHLNEKNGQRANDEQRYLHGIALEGLRSAFCLLLTAVGIPMILAGDEFGDVHDLDHRNWRLKMSDPVDWERRDAWPNNLDLWYKVAALIDLRKTHPALLRNETEFFYFHPDFDRNDGARVLAYCRTHGRPLGQSDQVVIIANLGPQTFSSFNLPWYWNDTTSIVEIAPPQLHAPLQRNDSGSIRLSLAPFQVRVFRT